jgi:phosphotransferase system HPr-like phosphotransfer protein
LANSFTTKEKIYIHTRPRSSIVKSVHNLAARPRMLLGAREIALDELMKIIILKGKAKQ